MPFFFNFSQEFKYVISVPIFHVATSVCALFALCSISQQTRNVCVLSKKKNPQVRDCLWKGCEKLVDWVCLFRKFIWLKKSIADHRTEVMSYPDLSSYLFFCSSRNKLCPRNRNSLMAMLCLLLSLLFHLKTKGIEQALFRS